MQQIGHRLGSNPGPLYMGCVLYQLSYPGAPICHYFLKKPFKNQFNTHFSMGEKRKIIVYTLPIYL